MITEEGNPFVIQYKDQCEVLIKKYNKKQLSEEEKLFEYLQAMKDNDNKIIAQRSPLLFSDGAKMGGYWSNKKDKIYQMVMEKGNPFIVKYRAQCEALINEYNKKQLSKEEKLLEYLQAMKDNGNKIIPNRSSLLFSDGTQMGRYWSNYNNRDKVYQMVMEEGNPFVAQYKEQCEVLIKEYNNYQEKPETKITEKEKLLEYLQAMKENDNKIIPKRSSLLFSDGTKMAYYWSDKKDKIYIMIMEEDNQFIVKYKDQCEVLINEYNKKQLSDEKKLLEYLQAIKDNDNKIIPYNSSLLFSDGTQMGIYRKNTKDKIYKMIIEVGNSFITQYKDQCEVLIKEYNNYQEHPETKITEEEKLLEYLKAMKENDNKIIDQRSPLLFSDGAKMAYYWRNSKDKIYKMIIEEGNQFIIQYKEQCEVIINEYIEFQEKSETKITEEEKLLEYLQAIKDNDNKIIPYNSPLLFSDGTQMAYYWSKSNNKDKIYKMIIEEENQFIIKYKEQCEVLINEYIKFQERKKKKQEKYKKSESEFKEESLFDKTLKNEKGKYSNEGKKVL